MDYLDAESQQTRELYAYFCLAIYCVQCFECTMVILMATVFGPGPIKITRTQYDELIESNFKKTLGQLIFTLRKDSSIPDDLNSILTDALEKRNWLAHHYFWDRVQKFQTEDGKKEMIKELRETIEYFVEKDKILTLILTNWGIKHGITEEMIQKQRNIFMHRNV